jgi:CRISPR-associated protein Cas5d
LEAINKVCFRVYGRYALFSDPITRVGGEKSSYPVPTYQALKGIAESVYWKPTFTWIIDRVKILSPIDMESKNIKNLKYNDGTSDLSIYSYLINPDYLVETHLIWNENRRDLSADRDYKKHLSIMLRSIDKGGRRDIFLGTRECQGYVEPAVFDEVESPYSGKTMTFGTMVHGLTYPDESKDGRSFEVRLWNPQMKDGIINFPSPNECKITIPVRNYEYKKFTPGINFTISE